MSNSNFDKNGVDKYGTHWLQYAAFVVTAFAIYFGWALSFMGNLLWANNTYSFWTFSVLCGDYFGLI